MRTLVEEVKLPVVMIVSKKEPSGLIFEIVRQQTYPINFYCDVVETQRQATTRIKQLAEKGREVIGVIIDERCTTLWEKHWPVVQVEKGEATAFGKKIHGKQWDKAAAELFEIIQYENISGTP